jgi:hypothetical protein
MLDAFVAVSVDFDGVDVLSFNDLDEGGNEEAMF